MVIPKEIVEEDLTICTALIDRDKDVIRANDDKYLHIRDKSSFAKICIHNLYVASRSVAINYSSDRVSQEP